MQNDAPTHETLPSDRAGWPRCALHVAVAGSAACAAGPTVRPPASVAPAIAAPVAAAPTRARQFRTCDHHSLSYFEPFLTD